MRRHVSAAIVQALLAGLALTTACAKTSPSAPTSAAKPNVSIASISVAAEALSSGGYSYRVTVTLRESGGVAATIAAIDLTFVRESATLTSLRVDRPISDTANVVPANATVDSREMTTTDTDPSHPAATSVVAKVTLADAAATVNSATATADIAPPPAATYTLSGTVRDEGSARMLAGATVQILDGPNAGQASSTDAGGSYSLPGLAGGGFTVRATMHGYNPREQSATIARDTILDLALRPIPAAPQPPPSPAPPPPASCAYTVAPSETGIEHTGGSFTATISRTSGSCSWQASSDVNWITFPAATSGNASGTLAYTIAANGSLNSRSGHITISWAGGSAQIRLLQGNHPDWECLLTLDKGAQDLDNVPSAGAQLTVGASIVAIPREWDPACVTQITVVSTVPWITGGGSGTPFPPMRATFTFSVAPNPTPGTARTGSIRATAGGKTATLAVTER
jgi:hypothetical protein